MPRSSITAAIGPSWQRLQARLRLARLAGLVAEAVDEGLHVLALHILLGLGGRLQGEALAARMLEIVIAAGMT